MHNDQERSKWSSVDRRSVLRGMAVSGGSVSLLANATNPRASECGGPGAGGSPPPGPPVLYSEPATAPPLETIEPWQADPLLVSGTDGYIDGEYLYQDFVYDDYGANTSVAVSSTPPDPKQNENDDFSAPTGDLSYPTKDATYRHNAADLLEFRVQNDSNHIRYRITLNTMVEPDAAGIAIGINTDRNQETGTDELGYGIGALGDLGLDHVVVTWGTGAELDGASVPSSVDTTRNQIDVSVPLQPDDEIWRHYLVVGLFDTDRKQFKQVQMAPDEHNPGGGNGQNPPPVFNVGFRFAHQEPMGLPNLRTESIDREIAEGIEERSGSRGFGYGHWREHGQAKALAARDISAFHADIDFAKLHRRVRDVRVPETGYLNRLYPSSLDLGEGFDDEENVFLGPVQPYAVYIPEGYDDEPTPFHLHLHANRSSYNELGVYMPQLIRQLGAERGAIVLTPEARGPGRFYHDLGEISVFEAWADVRNRYNIDVDRVTVDGYSTGGYGAIKLASQYPDLFAKAFSTVGFAGAVGALMRAWEAAYNIRTEIQDVAQLSPNLRHVPLLLWNGGNDEIVQPPEPIAYEQRLRDHGYRHELDLFTGYDHLTFLYRDQWGPARAFLDGKYLGEAGVARNPARVTYRVVPALDAEEYDLVHDKAYWVSDIEVAADADSGLVDVESKALQGANQRSTDYRITGTEPDPHVRRGTQWEKQLLNAGPRNELDIALDQVTSLTLWIADAGLDEEEPIELSVRSTDPATITLAGSFGSHDVDVPAGQSSRTGRLCQPG